MTYTGTEDIILYSYLGIDTDGLLNVARGRGRGNSKDYVSPIITFLCLSDFDICNDE